MGIAATAIVALALGYVLGRLRPWTRLRNWAQGQVRFTGAWDRGHVGQQAVVVLAYAVT